LGDHSPALTSGHPKRQVGGNVRNLSALGKFSFLIAISGHEPGFILDIPVKSNYRYMRKIMRIDAIVCGRYSLL